MSASEAIRIGFPFAAVVLGTGFALNAIRVDRRPLYALAKGVASAGFVLLALSGTLNERWEPLVVAALVLAAVGDVVLGLGGKKSFVAGTGIFAAAHLLFISAIWPVAAESHKFVDLLIDAVAVAGLAAWWGRSRIKGRLYPALVLYALIVSVMAAVGVAAGLVLPSVTLGVGAALVAGSDVAVAREEFVARSFVNRLWGLPLYYIGQVLIALTIASR